MGLCWSAPLLELTKAKAMETTECNLIFTTTRFWRCRFIDVKDVFTNFLAWERLLSVCMNANSRGHIKQRQLMNMPFQVHVCSFTSQWVSPRDTQRKLWGTSSWWQQGNLIYLNLMVLQCNLKWIQVNKFKICGNFATYWIKSFLCAKLSAWRSKDNRLRRQQLQCHNR